MPKVCGKEVREKVFRGVNGKIEITGMDIATFHGEMKSRQKVLFEARTYKGSPMPRKNVFIWALPKKGGGSKPLPKLFVAVLQ